MRRRTARRGPGGAVVRWTLVAVLTLALCGCAGLGGGRLIAAASADSAGASTTSPAEATASTPDATPASTGSGEATTGAAAFPAQAEALDESYPSSLGIAALDLTTGRSVAYNTASTFYTASIVKVDLVEAMLLRAQDRGRTLSATEAAWAKAAITVSDNDAASDMFASLGRAAGLTSYNVRLGMVGTLVASAWGLTRTSVADQIQLLRNLTADSVLTEPSRATLRSLMSQVEVDQRWGVPAAGDGGAVVKNGWLSYTGDGGGWIVNSIGIVTSKGRTLLVAVLTRKGSSRADGIAEVEQAATLAVSALTA